MQYPVNIGQKKGYSIKESAEIIADLINFEGTLIFNTNYSDGAKIKILDDNNFRKLFPEFIFTELKTGIKKTVDYYASLVQ